MRRHVQAKQGDHAKAAEAWRSTLRLPLALPQIPPVAAQPQPLLDSLQVNRARFPVAVLDRNFFIMPYTSHMSRLTLHQFTTMTTAAICKRGATRRERLARNIVQGVCRPAEVLRCPSAAIFAGYCLSQ
jgi:hypothetical protein